MCRSLSFLAPEGESYAEKRQGTARSLRGSRFVDGGRQTVPLFVGRAVEVGSSSQTRTRGERRFRQSRESQCHHCGSPIAARPGAGRTRRSGRRLSKPDARKLDIRNRNADPSRRSRSACCFLVFPDGGLNSSAI